MDKKNRLLILAWIATLLLTYRLGWQTQQPKSDGSALGTCTRIVPQALLEPKSETTLADVLAGLAPDQLDDPMVDKTPEVHKREKPAQTLSINAAEPLQTTDERKQPTKTKAQLPEAKKEPMAVATSESKPAKAKAERGQAVPPEEEIEQIVQRVLQAQRQREQKPPLLQNPRESPNTFGADQLGGTWRCSNGMSIRITDATQDDLWVEAYDRVGASVGEAHLYATGDRAYAGQCTLRLRGTQHYGQVVIEFRDYASGRLFTDYFIVDRFGREVCRLPTWMTIHKQLP